MAPSQFNEPIPNQTTSFDIYGQPPAADPCVDPNPQPAADPAYNPNPEPTADPYAAYNPTQQPVAEPYNPVPQPAVNNGPPLPATGLPADGLWSNGNITVNNIWLHKVDNR